MHLRTSSYGKEGNDIYTYTDAKKKQTSWVGEGVLDGRIVLVAQLLYHQPVSFNPTRRDMCVQIQSLLTSIVSFLSEGLWFSPGPPQIKVDH